MSIEDGELDYSQFSREELLEALSSIEPERFPRNYQRLLDALGVDDPATIEDGTIYEVQADSSADNPVPDRSTSSASSTVDGCSITLAAVFFNLSPFVLAWLAALLLFEFLPRPDTDSNTSYVLLFVLVAFFWWLLPRLLPLRCPSCESKSLIYKGFGRWFLWVCRSCGFRYTGNKSGLGN